MNTPLLSLGSLIDGTFFHYKKHFPSIVGITLWLLVAALPSGIGVLLSTPGNDTGAMSWMSFGFHVLGIVLTIFFSLHVTVALLLSIDAQHKGELPHPGDMLRKAFSYDVRYFWSIVVKNVVLIAFALAPLIVGIGCFFLAQKFNDIPFFSTLLGIAAPLAALLSSLFTVIFAIIHYTFVPYAVVFEKKSGLRALTASGSLIKGRWWQVFFRIFIPSLLYTVLFVSVLGLLLWLTTMLGITLTQNSFFFAKIFAITNIFLSTLVNALMIPLFLITQYLVYENLQSTSSR